MGGGRDSLTDSSAGGHSPSSPATLVLLYIRRNKATDGKAPVYRGFVTRSGSAIRSECCPIAARVGCASSISLQSSDSPATEITAARVV